MGGGGQGDKVGGEVGGGRIAYVADVTYAIDILVGVASVYVV